MSEHSIFDLSGKCVLVTGASGGLGAHFADVAAAAGARVVLAARREDRLAEQVAAITGRGGLAHAVAIDVCDQQSIATALDRIEREVAPLDVLVNNAGISVVKAFLDTDEEDWRRQLDTNVIGLASVARHAAQRMRDEERPGSIINIGSILGLRPGNMAAAYGATKAAVIHLTRGMSLELARYRIRVNALLPGYIPSDLSDLKDNPAALERLQRQVPMGRVGEMGDLDGALLLLAADASRYMTGSTVTVDGGHSSNSL
ncbi:SDR family oxidoreductase [Seongchinamella sediminis]|uniref:SDR family oxidoreductase n=1 Tax=Seongchinamella sediminis TaxID=2283635 RepID=A0A3L7DY64_9GAMM|nr:SDR family oxidoreductase [Seongchinamella sediminis]RLQ22528.1 SDR family oxidoreductase [Seongchinamella sediminis]